MIAVPGAVRAQVLLVLATALWVAPAASQQAAAPAPSAAATATPPPVELFFADPVLSEARISPDGREVAVRIGAKGRHFVLAVLPVDTLQPKVVASYMDQDVGNFQWVGAHRLAYDTVPRLVGLNRIDVYPGLFAVNDDGSGFRDLGGATMWVSSYSAADDGMMYVADAQEIRGGRFDYFKLYRLDTNSGEKTAIETPLHSEDFVLDQTGTLRAVSTSEGARTRVLVRVAGGEWKSIDEYNPFVSGGLEPRYVGADGKLYLSGSRGRNTRALYTYDFSKGALTEKPLLTADQYDIDPVLLVSQDKLIGVRYWTDSETTAWLDPAMKKAQDALDKRLPGRVNRIGIPHRALPEVVLVTSYADRVPETFYLYDIAADRLTLIGTSLPGIDPRQMGKTYAISYDARDGRPIPAYVTFPPGRERKNLPFIVLVHGGPFVRGRIWGWDSEVQFLASRGYAVLQPEYRGSTGFGGEHFRAGWKQWGLKMQDDLADGARWAIGQGLADPGRICIAGASYGGYATLMGLVNDPKLYRCGIAWAAVTDLRLLGSRTWSESSDLYRKFGLPNLVGDETADAEQLKATSPIENVDRITRPLLLAHGGYDTRVPIVHGERLRSRLEGKVPGFEWVRYDEEPHGWTYPETRIDFWTRVERFLSVNLPAP